VGQAHPYTGLDNEHEERVCLDPAEFFSASWSGTIGVSHSLEQRDSHLS